MTPATAAAAATKRRNGYFRSDRVFHQKFGDGTIIGFETNERGNMLAIVNFDRPGTKRVSVDFLTMALPSAQIIPFPTNRIRRRITVRIVDIVGQSSSSFDAAA